jgi:hypothetical protein
MNPSEEMDHIRLHKALSAYLCQCLRRPSEHLIPAPRVKYCCENPDRRSRDRVDGFLQGTISIELTNQVYRLRRSVLSKNFMHILAIRSKDGHSLARFVWARRLKYAVV